MSIFIEIAIVFALLSIASAIRGKNSSNNDTTIEIDWAKYAPPLMLALVALMSWFMLPAVLSKIAEVQAGHQLTETTTSPFLTALPILFTVTLLIIPIAFMLKIRENRK